jgi:hypothetical protein
MGGACSAYVETEEAYKEFWWGNLKGKRPFVRPRRRWEDKKKMDLQEVGCGEFGLDQVGSG